MTVRPLASRTTALSSGVACSPFLVGVQRYKEEATRAAAGFVGRPQRRCASAISHRSRRGGGGHMLVFLVAMRDIQRGQELLVDYDPSYWIDRMPEGTSAQVERK